MKHKNLPAGHWDPTDLYACLYSFYNLEVDVASYGGRRIGREVEQGGPGTANIYGLFPGRDNSEGLEGMAGELDVLVAA